MAELKQAVILAGGKGSRLRPMTLETPKPLLKVKGKTLLEYNIELAKKNGLTEVILAVGYLGEKIREFFGNGKKFGVSITYTREEKPLGTGGALRLSSGLLDERFAMMNGDELKEVDFRKMLEVHEKNKAIATLALTEAENAKDLGTVEMEGEKITEFREKESEGPALINAGAYILEKKILELIPDGFCSIEKEIFPKLAEQGRLFGWIEEGQWFPTDTVEKMGKAEKGWKESG